MLEYVILNEYFEGEIINFQSGEPKPTISSQRSLAYFIYMYLNFSFPKNSTQQTFYKVHNGYKTLCDLQR